MWGQLDESPENVHIRRHDTATTYDSLRATRVTDLLARLTSALAGRYRVERELGAGGMALVFLAHDQKHDRRVAIKVLKPELGAALGAERFFSEIKVTANLQHPNLLPLFDSGDADGLLYYVMPYVEGETLRARLDREPQLPLDEVRALVTSMANALDYAHAHGVVHRDLKPENVLVQAGQPVIADFGIALAVSNAGGSRVTETGLSLGTPHYMSPEQAAGDRAVDARSDQYALGALAYEMITGEPPHTGATAQVIIARLMTETPRDIRTIRPPIPESVNTAVQRALAKSPADRFTSCVAFARALASHETQTHASPLSQAAKPPRFGLIAVGVIGTALAVLSSVVWFTTNRNRTPTVVAGADLIAVMPLGAASDSSLTRLGQDLVVTISANLDGVDSLRSIDAATLLVRAQKLPAPIPLEEAQKLAKELGARSVLTGTLIREGARIRATVVLHLVGSDSVLAKASALVDQNDIALLTDSLSLKVLQGVWRRGKVPSPVLTDLTTRNFDALRAFLEGERRFQRLDTRGALIDYRKAFELDSNFVQAYLRYDYVNDWILLPADSVVHRRLLELKDRLPERERLWVETREVQLRQPIPQRIATWKALAQRYPDYPPFLMAAADPIVHSGPVYGIPLTDATPLLDRLDQLVPDHADTKLHQSAVAWYNATPEKAAALTRKASELTSGWFGTQLALIAEALQTQATNGALPGPELALRMARERMKDGDERPATLMMAGLYGFRNPPLPYQLQMVERVKREQILTGVIERASHLGEAILLAGTGRWDDAVNAARKIESSELPLTLRMTAVRISVMGAWLDAVDVSSADSAWQRLQAAPVKNPSAGERAEMLWLDGMIGMLKHDENRYRIALQQLQSDTSRLYTHTARTLSGMRLNVTNPNAAADSLRAVTDDVMRTGGFVMPAEGLARLLIARTLRQRNEYAAVERYNMWLDGALNTAAQLTAQFDISAFAEFERGAAFDAMGKSTEALTHYHRFVDNYVTPPPAHVARVEEAKQRIAILEKPDAAKSKAVPK